MLKEIEEKIGKILLEREFSDQDLFALIKDEVEKYSKKEYLNIDEKIAAVDKIYSRIRGFGVIDDLIDDDEISEIMINGYDQIFV